MAKPRAFPLLSISVLYMYMLKTRYSKSCLLIQHVWHPRVFVNEEDRVPWLVCEGKFDEWTRNNGCCWGMKMSVGHRLLYIYFSLLLIIILNHASQILNTEKPKDYYGSTLKPPNWAGYIESTCPSMHEALGSTTSSPPIHNSGRLVPNIAVLKPGIPVEKGGCMWGLEG